MGDERVGNRPSRHFPCRMSANPTMKRDSESVRLLFRDHRGDKSIRLDVPLDESLSPGADARRRVDRSISEKLGLIKGTVLASRLHRILADGKVDDEETRRVARTAARHGRSSPANSFSERGAFVRTPWHSSYGRKIEAARRWRDEKRLPLKIVSEEHWVRHLHWVHTAGVLRW